MRRAITIVVLSLVASGLFASPHASAAAPWPATFRGLTDPQQLPIELNVIRRSDGRLGLRELSLTIELACPSGDRVFLQTGAGFIPSLPLDGHRLVLDRIYWNQAIHVQARVGPNRVRGTAWVAFAAFTPDERLQRCDTEPQTFVAERVPGGSGTATVTRSPDVRTTLPVHHRWLFARHDAIRALPDTTAEPGVRYEGMTAQHLPIGIHIDGTIDQGSLSDGHFDIRMRCDDGTTGGTWGFGIVWVSGGPPVRDGYFAADDVGLDMALHWPGHLGPSRAYGRITLEVPAFTQDERLQRCGSRDVRWWAHIV
jgi:hypothetical protein